MAHAREVTVIDFTVEEAITLAAAARLVPPARSGKRCHLSTILRWIVKGAKAPDGSTIRLEGARVGGRWLTSLVALRRFSQHLTPQLEGKVQPASRGPGQRRRASERAAAELEQLGV
jgi:hypothetical protein